MAKIERRGDMWTTRISLTDPDTGERIQRRITARTKRAVEDEVARLRNDWRTGSYIEPSETPLGVYLDEWFARYHQSPSTRHSRRFAIKRIKSHSLGRIPIGRLSVKHVQDFVDELRAEKYARSTIDNTLAPINMAMDRALLHRLIREHPCRGLTLPPQPALMHAVLVEAEAKRLISQIDDPLHAFWTLAVTLGIRGGELVGLRWSDFDSSRAMLSIARTRTRTEDGQWVIGDDTKSFASLRTLRLPLVCVQALAKHRHRQLERRLAAGPAWTRSDLIFDNGIGEPLLKPHLLNRAWVTTVEEVGITHVRIHDLRHTAATHMIRAGIPIPTVSRILGHAKPDITMRVYAHVIESMEQDAADRIDGMYGMAPESIVTVS